MMRDTFPTPETIDKWDDPSLFSTCGLQASDSAQTSGLGAVNDVERVLCCLFHLCSSVNNGGFGMWLADTHPNILLATVPALQEIGARPMASFVEEVLSGLDDLKKFETVEDWQAYLDRLPESYLNELESLSTTFTELEAAFLQAAYTFTREHWQQVRIA